MDRRLLTRLSDVCWRQTKAVISIIDPLLSLPGPARSLAPSHGRFTCGLNEQADAVTLTAYA